MTTLHDLVVDARGRLSRAGVPDADVGLDAELLARAVLGWDRAQVLVHRHDQAPTGFREAYRALIHRREQREPTPYIVGVKEFWGLEFELSPDVLIPRPETELLVEEALACARELPAAKGPRVIVDAGTGCGCLAVALARELADTLVMATDISAAALQIARRNAVRHGVADRIQFLRTNFLTAIGDRVDLIVSNPPYIPISDTGSLPPEVRNFEPHVALFAGAEGLDMHRIVLGQASERLTCGGYLLMEFGAGQAHALRTTIDDFPTMRLVRTRVDLQGIPRTAIVRHD